jgi:hypothetical protein
MFLHNRSGTIEVVPQADCAGTEAASKQYRSGIEAMSKKAQTR